MDLPDDELLITARKQPEAFAAFYRRHERTLLAYFMRRTGDPELAADLTAETFATVLARLSSFEAARGSALAWTFGIARHKLLRASERGRAQAEAVRAHVLEEQPYERLASRLQCSESVVRQRVSRGLAKLRSVVKESP